MHKIYLALGSNVGKKEKYIKRAIELLLEKVDISKIANIYISRAVGITDQDDFLNTAVYGYTKLKPQELLEFVKDIENRIGRKKRYHRGPREIDIDILFYDDMIVQDDNLIIPHMRIIERDFVLKPLMDIDPEHIHPIFKKTIKELYQSLPEEKYSIVKMV